MIVLGADDGGLELLELGLLRARLALEERLHRVDLGGEFLVLGLLRGQGGGERLDLAEASRISSSSLPIDALSWAIWFWIALYSSFFLT